MELPVSDSGWSSGSPKPILVPLWIVSKGYVLASISYRSSSKVPFPAQIEDCKASIRWLRAHAGKYGFDPKRIGIWGISAGGHLVSLTGTSGGVKELEREGPYRNYSSRVSAVVNYCGLQCTGRLIAG